MSTKRGVLGPLAARLVSILVVSALIFAATRSLVRMLPGDPLETLMAESGTSLPAAAINESLHLDEPYFVALRKDLTRAFHGDLGVSIITRQPIAPLLARRFVRTAELATLALLLALLLGLGIGLPAALGASGAGGRFARAADLFCSIYGATIAALPTPWLGPMLIIVFGVWWQVVPIGDSVLLPALTLALAYSGLWARLIRDRTRETLIHGAAQGARARGISEPWVLIRYGLAPSAGALVAYFGTQAGGLLTGAFVTELIFDWHGLGSLLVESVLKRDYPVVECTTFVAAVVSLLGTAVGDWMQLRIDPRLR